MAIRAVIFDLDGTITQPCFDFDAIRREMGFPPDAGPVLELMQKMDPSQRKHADAVLLAHEQRAVDLSSLNTGALETLSMIRERGIPVGILTRNLTKNALAVAKKHSICFDMVIGREDGPAKPDPYGVLEICRSFRVNPKDTLVVGDYIFDLLCARNAGAVPVWFRNSKAAEDFSSSADYTITELSQLVRLLDTSEEKASA